MPTQHINRRARVAAAARQLEHPVVDEREAEPEAESSTSQSRAKMRALDERQVKVLKSAAEYYVHSLPGLGELSSHPTHPLTVHAGEIPSYPGEGKGGGEGATGKDGEIFFMMVRARRSAGKQRVVFWFNGGPGCSSFDGSMMEVGPWRTVPESQTESKQVELKLVEGGWEEYATMVYVDQPPGTGFSFIPSNGYLHELSEASAHLIRFLENFYTIFPELDGSDVSGKPRPAADVQTYLAGESYAGQYIPYFADALLKKDEKTLPNFNFQGIAIGNGWIDPLRQYPAYLEFAYEKKLIKKGSDDDKAAHAAMDECAAWMKNYTDPLITPINIPHCGGVMDSVTRPAQKEIDGHMMCLNIYDVRLVDTYPACGMNWPPDLSDVYKYLARRDVVEALHATKHQRAWKECDDRVGNQMRAGKSPASVHLLPGILEKGVKVLMFAGDEDLICNYIGIERMIEVLDWSGEVGFGANVTAKGWYLNDTQVGEWTTDRNLSYARLFESSHMAGFDVPHVTNDMIMRFMDVDLNLLPGLTGAGTSRVGDDKRPAVHFGPQPTTTGMPILKAGKGDWEEWYNAVSAVLILLTLIGIVGVYLFVRHRRIRRGLALPTHSHRRSNDGNREERMPLAGANEYELEEGVGGNGVDSRRKGKGKGKSRARASEEFEEEDEGKDPNTVFALGDEDEHEYDGAK
ncbi:Cell death protease [Vanrija albida]|uniref:Carboxypeptidase n=1 Tax=Vanrija albida TaxID=181172 RepID=A0ABR3Q6X7_9TREE